MKANSDFVIIAYIYLDKKYHKIRPCIYTVSLFDLLYTDHHFDMGSQDNDVELQKGMFTVV